MEVRNDYRQESCRRDLDGYPAPSSGIVVKQIPPGGNADNFIPLSYQQNSRERVKDTTQKSRSYQALYAGQRKISKAEIQIATDQLYSIDVYLH